MKFFSKKIVLPSLALATAVALLPSCNNGGGGKGSGGGSTPSDGPADVAKPHHVREKNLASGLTSIYQYGYGVYMVVMTPSQMKGMVSSFYLYDNMADLKSFIACDSSKTLSDYDTYSGNKNSLVMNWFPTSDEKGNPPPTDGSGKLLSLTNEANQISLDSVKALKDKITSSNLSQCGWPSNWHEIDFEFVPGFTRPSDAGILRPAIQSGCLSADNCTTNTNYKDASNFISFNTFNMNTVSGFKIKDPGKIQGTQYATTTPGNKDAKYNYYMSNNIIPDYADKDYNSNLNVFYDAGNGNLNKEQLYVIYYTPIGIFWSKNEDPAQFPSDTLPSTLPNPVFVKNDHTNSDKKYDPNDYTNLKSTDVMFRYNQDAFNHSPSDSTDITTKLARIKDNNKIIGDISNNNLNFHTKYDGTYTSAKMNISLNLWDGSSEEDGFWGGKTAPSGTATAQYSKIAYYPLTNLNIKSVDDVKLAQNYETKPMFYSDFKSGNHYAYIWDQSGNQTQINGFQNIWAVDDTRTPDNFWSDNDLSKNVYLFSNRYIYPLGQFHNGLIKCDTSTGLTLTSTPLSVKSPNPDTIQGCYTKTP